MSKHLWWVRFKSRHSLSFSQLAMLPLTAALGSWQRGRPLFFLRIYCCFSILVSCFWIVFRVVIWSREKSLQVTLDALTPSSVHSLWRSPKCLNRLCLTVFSSLRSSLLLVRIFLYDFFQSMEDAFHLLCFDTALLEQPPLSVMALCDLPSLWRVSLIVFWTIAKSAVFSIIVVPKNKRYPEFILYGWSFIETQM